MKVWIVESARRRFHHGNSDPWDDMHFDHYVNVPQSELNPDNSSARRVSASLSQLHDMSRELFDELRVILADP